MPSKREKYSRHGCEQCRRRKVKCDEARPVCHNCQKGSRVCKYIGPKPRKPRSDKGVARQRSKNKLSQSSPGTGSSTGSSVSDTLLQYDALQFDISGILSTSTEDLTHQFFNDSALGESPPNPRPLGLMTEKYLNYFSKYYSKMVLPLTGTYHRKEAEDILLEHGHQSNYLMDAILCFGAYQCFAETGDSAEEQVSLMYLYDCMEALSSVLSNQGTIEENVESILLTTLLLGLYSVVSNAQRWRPHIKAVKGLLAAYVLKDRARKYQLNWHIIAFCWSWCTSIEVIATMTAPTGGTVLNEAEIESVMLKLPELLNCIQDDGICRKDGFNYMYGYTNELYDVLQQINKYRFRLKGENPPNASVKVELEDIQDLLFRLKTSAEFYIVDKRGWSSPNDPLPLQDEEIPPNSLEELLLDDGKKIRISWCDMCQQCYVSATQQIVYTKLLGLPCSHYIVQKLVRQFLNTMIFLRATVRTTNSGLYLLLCPAFVTALNCVEEHDRDQILEFFHCLEGLLTNYSCVKSNMEKIQSIWTRYDSSKESHDTIFSISDDAGTDTIAY